MINPKDILHLEVGEMWMTKQGPAYISKLYVSPIKENGSADVWVNGKMRIYNMTGEIYNPFVAMNLMYKLEYLMTKITNPEYFI